MEELVFNSQIELHDRLIPALKSKRKILNKSGYSYIREEHIWKYMIQKWTKHQELALCEMVDQILHTDNLEIVNYYNNVISSVDLSTALPKLKNT